jgi:hypothetical protein
VRKYTSREIAEKRIKHVIVERLAGGSEEDVLVSLSLAALERQSGEIAALERGAQAHCLALMEKGVAGLRLDAEEKVRNACERATFTGCVAAMDNVKSRGGVEEKGTVREWAIALKLQGENAHLGYSSVASAGAVQ